MDEQLMDELSDLPGWEELVAAGAVPPVNPRVLENVRTEVRHAAEHEHLSPRKASPRPGRRWGLWAAALSAAAAVAVALLLAGRGPHERPAATPATAPATSTSKPPAASCVELYSLTNLAHRSLAFDGTVGRIASINEPPDAKIGRVQVTLTVNRWYRGGTARQVTVITSGRSSLASDAVPLQVGARLLVSGEIQAGALPPIAWTGCGFTRPYDAETAADWASVLRK